MSQAKYSPGPWEADFDQTPYEEPTDAWLVNAESGSICMIDSPEDQEANAILIAAAPDLFQALVGLEAEISSRFSGNHERAPEFMTDELRRKVLAARTALNKAKGETQ